MVIIANVWRGLPFYAITLLGHSATSSTGPIASGAS